MKTKNGRRDQGSSKFQALKAAVQAGMDSGVSDSTVPQIMEGVEARLRAKGKIPMENVESALAKSTRLAKRRAALDELVKEAQKLNMGY